MPWREQCSPYRTWVSEIMLQQTQVATAIPFYHRFLERFPDITTLAEAAEDDVLSCWAGLGYYSRARNLQRTAREVVADRGGVLPDTAEGLRQLPGIGPYTAAAIASIAFGRPDAVVDGNVIRVMARLYALRGSAKSAQLQRSVWRLARSNLATSRPGDWNQALMELGATVCLPNPDTPRCGECPLSADCAARRSGLQQVLPDPGPRRRTVRLEWSALWIERRGRLLLWHRGAEERFLPGHWGLPEARHLPTWRPAEKLAVVRHTITNHLIRLTVRRGRSKAASLPVAARWVPLREIAHHLVSSLWRKAIARVKS